MRFFASASAVLAFAASAIAQTADFNPVYSPKDGEVVPAGSTYEVTWSAPAKYKDGTVSISLIGGADQSTLVPITDLASGIANSAETYSWTVDPALGAEQLYGLVFKLESNPDIFQYSQPFTIKKSGNGNGNGGDNSKTSTVVTATGIKTITLTSCPPEETTTTPNPIETTTPPPVVTPTFTTSYHQNTTTTHITSKPLPPPTTSIVAPEPTVPAPVPEPEEPAPQPEEPTPSPPPQSAGARLAAGPIALIGGLAMAYLAL